MDIPTPREMLFIFYFYAPFFDDSFMIFMCYQVPNGLLKFPETIRNVTLYKLVIGHDINTYNSGFL